MSISTNTPASRADVEIRKLQQEVAALEFENSYKGRLLKSLTGLSVLVAGIGLAVTYTQGNAQRAVEQRQAELKLLTDTLERGTNANSSPAARFVAAWSLVPYWTREQYDDLLANGLAAILISDPEQAVRLAAADVLGVAIRPDTSTSRKKRLARLLYGSSETWDVGAVVAQGYAVTHDTSERRNPPSRAEQLLAVREAIRKNWEYLERGHFATLELSGILLNQADLRGAYLGSANLAQADLQWAQIADTVFDGASLRWTNISDVQGVPKSPPNFREWALAQGAVEMSQQSFERWATNGFKQPDVWSRWRQAGFPVDAMGRPQ
jgi:hypothetical protein